LNRQALFQLRSIQRSPDRARTQSEHSAIRYAASGQLQCCRFNSQAGNTRADGGTA
jgi:hypothetical protein